MVQRLTEENSALVHKLNEASRASERGHAREIQERKEREMLEVKWKEMEGTVGGLERENRALRSQVKVLGGELLGLEETLLRERSERLKVSSGNAGGDAMAMAMAQAQDQAAVVERLQADVVRLEREKVERENDLKEQIACERGRTEKAEAALREMEKAMTAMTKRRGGVPPQSVILSSVSMQAYAENNTSDENSTSGASLSLSLSSLPAEVRALLPMKTWIPSMDEQQTMQEDVMEAIGRLYERIEGLLEVHPADVGREQGTSRE